MSGEAAARALEACIRTGVQEFVACGGARNSALVLALARTEGLRLWNHFEERGAGFFALGRIMATGRPVAVVTTSGTAAAELLPAVIEAHYQGRPLLLVTADRPARFRGSGAPQSIEQPGLFGGYVEGCDDGEGVELLAGWSGGRPWHLNVCQEEEEAVPVLSVPAERPKSPRPPRAGVIELVDFLKGSAIQGVVAMVGGLEPEEQEEAVLFLRDLNVPVVADATSGLREALGKLVLTDGDRLLRAQPPGRVLRLGAVPVGRFWRDLESLSGVEVLSITGSGFSGLARESTVISGRVHEVLKGAGSSSAIGDVLDYGRASARRKGKLEELLERFPDSEPALVRVVSTFATTGKSLFLGNSLPIREWNLCAQTSVPMAEVRANRGANGIDGQISTWLGATAGADGAWGVFGDLTVLYDLAAPALLEQMEGKGRVLVVLNNGGGRIFERLPRLRGIPERERALMANAHNVRLGEWAAMWGMDHVVVNDRESCELEPGVHPLVVEVFPDEQETESFWEAWSAE